MNLVHIKTEDSRSLLPAEAMGGGAKGQVPGDNQHPDAQGRYGPVAVENRILGPAVAVPGRNSSENVMRSFQQVPHPAVALGNPISTSANSGLVPDPIPAYSHPTGNYQANNGMSDPSLQEYLSPFFQPYGVDVSHFPLTNPPIFQSSLTNFSDHPRRRRISISNGQISQLGEAGTTFDDLYYSQPPPMPTRHDLRGTHVAQQPQQLPQAAQLPARPPLPHQHSGHASHLEVPTVHPSQAHLQPNMLEPSNPVAPSQHSPRSQEYSVLPLHSHPHPITPIINDEIDPKDTSASRTFGTNQDRKEGMGIDMLRDHHAYAPKRQEVLPGTPAWKRARLLERNRIAASKCRQRKKVAQKQLQEDVAVLAEENTHIRKRLHYYEKLVSKFKKFTEMHMATCGGSEQLSMIEELLKIDHNMTELSPDESPIPGDTTPQ
ncbi:LADA_0A05820g1_1 [Lachancea dasiensis]|uniref:LADA_0A05820g1_1 n=1 Tax=Lachancea dasiensis TaxID=1072105 RepID=A0A1G4IPQ4_9SACH|nr:LADA_0A05820g1_1 [Lachancea dasiensis]